MLGVWVHAGLAVLGATALILSVLPSSARAQSVMPGVDDVADSIAEMLMPKWVGPRVEFPKTHPRPEGTSLHAQSSTLPLAVHATENVSDTRVDKTMQALEFAYTTLAELGWRHPMPDGGLGDTSAFDLYLLGQSPKKATAYSDSRSHWSYLDRASSFSVLNAQLPTNAIASCTVFALAQAIMLSIDPAESANWRRETASFLSKLATGSYGCAEGIESQQANAKEGWLSKDTSREGGLFASLLSSRHDGGSGSFVRELWDLTSQRTWEGVDLRASPDLWMSIESALRIAGDPLIETIPAFAIQRYTSTHAHDSKPALLLRKTLSELPSRITSSAPILAFGSAYALVDTKNAQPNEVLRVWLRAEYGVRWAISAVRMGDNDELLETIDATTELNNPKAYLPIELTPEAKSVLIVVTNLSSRRLDEDVLDSNARSFSLAIDRTIAP